MKVDMFLDESKSRNQILYSPDHIPDDVCVVMLLKFDTSIAKPF